MARAFDHFIHAVGHAQGHSVVLRRMHGVVAVAAGDAQGGTRCDDARPRNVAGIDGVAQGDVGVRIGAHVTRRGESGLEHQARVLGARQCRARRRNGDAGVARVFRIARQVRVRIDQARQQRLVAKIDHGRAGGNGQAAAGRGDALAGNQYHRIVDQRAAAHVDHMRSFHRGDGRLGGSASAGKCGAGKHQGGQGSRFQGRLSGISSGHVLRRV
jgi:hypothetical protein